MSRPREFDIQHALRRAVEVFWTRGYEATSIDDLTMALGISRSSLYAAFGSKHGLYLEALDWYRQQESAHLAEVLDAAEDVAVVVRGLLEALAAEAVEDPARRGCLLVNAAMERIPGDQQVAERVGDTLVGFHAALRRAIARGQDADQIGRRYDADALAFFVLTTVQGLRVTGKALQDPIALRASIELTLAALQER